MNEKKALLKNFFSLAFIQGTNFLLPLIVLPYLIKTIGLENFGLVSFAQALMSYLIYLTDYGFNLNSTREIAYAPNDLQKVNNIVSSTLITKGILCLISFLLLAFAVGFTPKLSAHAGLYYLSFLLVLAQVVIPGWFFQGIEKMEYLTYINLIGKIIFTALIFVLITRPAHYMYVPVFYSMGNLISGLCALYIMRTKFNIAFRFPSRYSFAQELRKGWFVFVSNFSVNAYMNSNLFILGFFANSTVFGYFSIADKLVYALKQVINVFFSATYPRACQQIAEGFGALKTFFKRYFTWFALLTLAGCTGIFVLADFITLFLTGRYIGEVSFLVRMVCFVPFIMCLNVPAYQILLAYNLQKSFMIILVSGSIINILLNLLLAPLFSATGTALAIIITEVYITSGLYLIIQSRHRKYSLF